MHVTHVKRRVAWAGALTLVASLAPDIVVLEAAGSLPAWWLPAKVALLLAGAGAMHRVARDGPVAAYGLLLAVVVAMQAATLHAGGSAWWRAWFEAGTFTGEIGGTITLELLTAVPIAGALLLVTRSPRAAFLVPGDLRAKAARIGWLGIPEGTIAWGRLAILAGLAIAVGTLLLTLLTVTGFALPPDLDRLWPALPLIVVLALANSFAEGVAYRNAVLGPLAGALPKGAVALLSAAFFGVAHFYGAPSGIVGVIMSGALGWFLARGMYETRGFLAPWIIHFLQDVVIFSTILLLGGLS
jgi:membrane protease YdiL (CAAX protease family)